MQPQLKASTKRLTLGQPNQVQRPGHDRGPIRSGSPIYEGHHMKGLINAPLDSLGHMDLDITHKSTHFHKSKETCLSERPKWRVYMPGS